MLSRADCERMDASDPLASARANFVVPAERIYLNGNSLGLQPQAAAAAVQRGMNAWAQEAVGAWNSAGWIALAEKIAGLLAPLLGADPDELVVGDSTSINLYKLLHAALAYTSQERVLLIEQGNFPTDSYVAQGLQRPMRSVPAEQLLDAIDTRVGVVLLSHVHYRTGARQDMAAINARAAEVGAVVVWDLAHSAGAVPLDLHAAGTQYAVGCGYKFLNGGPGAPAYAYVARSRQARLQSPIQGWFGHVRPFAFDEEYQPAAGVQRLQVGTPPILSLCALQAALEDWSQVRLSKVWEKRQRLFELGVALCEQLRSAHSAVGDLRLLTPQDAERQGSQISLQMPMAGPVNRALQAMGVIGDFRAPDVLRFGLTPLYTRYVDVWDAFNVLHSVLRERRWDHPDFLQQPRVT